MLSIVIPVYEQAHCLERTLVSLTGQTVPPGEFEVVVVDDGSSQDVAGVVGRFGDSLEVTLVRQEANRGRSAARNRGVAHARGDRVLLMDADSYATPNLVQRHLRTDGERSPQVVFGRRLELTWASLARLHRGEFSEAHLLAPEGDHRDDPHGDKGGFDVYLRTPWMFGYTHNLSLPRALYEEVGGFDESFRQWGYEDTDFTYRIFRHFGRDGSCFRYDPAAVCCHLPHFRDWTREWENTRPVLPYLVDKYRHFDVEMFTYPSENHRRVARTLPYYEDLLAQLRNHPGRARADVVRARLGLDGTALWIGFGTNAAAGPGADVAFDHSAAWGVDNPHLFGVRLPYADGVFDHVVNIDLWRMLTPIDLSALVLEGTRVSRRGLVLVRSKNLETLPDSGVGMVSDLDYFMAQWTGRWDTTVLHDDVDLTAILVSGPDPRG